MIHTSFGNLVCSSGRPPSQTFQRHSQDEHVIFPLRFSIFWLSLVAASERVGVEAEVGGHNLFWPYDKKSDKGKSPPLPLPSIAVLSFLRLSLLCVLSDPVRARGLGSMDLTPRAAMLRRSPRPLTRQKRTRCDQFAEALERCVRSGLTAVHSNDENASQVYARLQVWLGLEARLKHII